MTRKKENPIPTEPADPPSGEAIIIAAQDSLSIRNGTAHVLPRYQLESAEDPDLHKRLKPSRNSLTILFLSHAVARGDKLRIKLALKPGQNICQVLSINDQPTTPTAPAVKTTLL